MYDFGLPSHKTLFRLQAERMKRLGQLSGKGGRVPWYIMTSPLNDAATRKYFEENDFFGLKSKDVMFFAQGTLPCLTTEGERNRHHQQIQTAQQ
jgi:UDP-N-acetylglucosamine/UDP-N-acetylgalactosamine diphosphorylase